MSGCLKWTALLFCVQLCIAQTGRKAEKKIVFTPLAPAPFNAYSQAVIVGDMVYLAGQIGEDVDKVLVSGITNQTRQVLQNIGFVLEAANSSFENVVKTTVMLANIGDARAYGAVYREFFPNDFPARSTFQVASLHLGALIEIEAVAYVAAGCGRVLNTAWVMMFILGNLLLVHL